MQDLKLSLFQTSLHWEDPTANLAMLEEKIWSIRTFPDIIVLPEMFSTGFSMNTYLSEHAQGRTFKWMQQMAHQTGSAMVGSVMIRVGEESYNRMFWVEPSGESAYYDKKHLFSIAKEDDYFSPGNERVIVQYKGWNISLWVCYDLRFPVWMRNRYRKESGLEYDLALVVANWPAVRVSAWNHLLEARAIENHAYTVGLNRTGHDGNDVVYTGNSGAYHPKGIALLHMHDEESIASLTLDAQSLLHYREKFPAYLDGDSFTLD